MNKVYVIACCTVMVVSLALGIFAFVTRGGEDSNITIVRTPAQAEAEWPPAVFNPMSLIVELPETPNLAEGRPVHATSFTDVYVPANAVDGTVTSYWESHGFPADFTITLDGVHQVSTVAVSVNPSLLWEARSQAFEVLVSTDNVNFNTVVPHALHDFDPLTGNTVRLDFAPTAAQYVRVHFTANTATRTMGAQAAAIRVFGS
ncbi:MAG: discoidin domain-containing protein [Defluviitaleaceae bacterium]|nr:discoidin domain-containing protein [Defluviitaleaceae bacterium]MCL2274466.1 discoidin domain-containing protein [Defluviitaleaceae bacterium]